MLKKISIHNFKVLKDVSYEPAPLNILMGLNGVGKSSFVQILLLLKQLNTNMVTMRQRVLPLNGDIVSLGTLRDILYCYSNKDDIVFSFSAESLPVDSITIRIPTNNADIESDSPAYLVENIKVEDKVPESVVPFVYFIEWCKGVQYISASRLGPQQEHRFFKSTLGDKNWGACGENAVAFLAENGDRTISNAKLLFSDKLDGTLQTQVDAWMSVISPGTNIHADKMSSISKALLSVSFAKGIAQNKFRPQNVGFGISYTLPIVIMLLSAKPGDCLIIENPEAHIHPKGQAEMGRLLALCASIGVQIFVETHSDHIVNGIRVAVKKQLIDKSDVKFAYFNRYDIDNNGLFEQYTDIQIVKIDPNGEFSDYPDGFMDEWNNQLLELL